jgi:predicted molibdopterin-dependent oxidoreductase YjgC
MQSNSIDRLLTPQQAAVERGAREALGLDVAHTNNMQELFTDAKNIMVVGPSIYEHAPIASYWINHARLYREARIIVVSTEHYLLCDRAALWLKPNEGTTDLLVDAISSEIVRLNLQASNDANAWAKSRNVGDLATIAGRTGIPAEQITQAAVLFVTGKIELPEKRPDEGFPPGVVYHTVAHQAGDEPYGDAARVAIACTNLSLVTGNIGRAGGGVASPRGRANYQGTTDMGLTPNMLPGGASVADAAARKQFEEAWLNRWAEQASTSNGFAPVRSLPAEPGVGLEDLAEAIESGTVKAMWIEGGFGTRDGFANDRLLQALGKLEYLVVVDAFDSALTDIANAVLPLALNIEKDGTFTNFDRTVQRVRTAVPPMGESRSEIDILCDVAVRMGYALHRVHAGQVMAEISRLVPAYAGVSYARLERGGIVTPVETFRGEGRTILGAAPGVAEITPRLVVHAG